VSYQAVSEWLLDLWRRRKERYCLRFRKHHFHFLNRGWPTPMKLTSVLNLFKTPVRSCLAVSP